MKKFFVALMAISITAALSGCDKTTEEHLIDDITEDTSVVTGAAETTSESVSETKTETSDEAVSGTDETTAKTSEAAEAAFGTVSEYENNDEPRLAQHEDLIGCWYLEDELILVFEENRYIELSGGWADIINDTVKDGILEFSDNDEPVGLGSGITAKIYGGKLCLEKEFDGEAESVDLERYTQPAVSLSDLDGEWLLEDEQCWGWLNLENGNGTFDPDGRDTPEVDAEISLNGNKVTISIGDDYKEEYTYYTLAHPNAFAKFIFLVNDEKATYMVCWY